MKTKNLYYEINVRIENSMSNSGFVKVEIKDGVPCVSGILTGDVFIGLVENDEKFKFAYFENEIVEENCEVVERYEPLFELLIDIEDFNLPATYTCDELRISIDYQIFDPLKIRKCNAMLMEVFNDEG